MLHFPLSLFFIQYVIAAVALPLLGHTSLLYSRVDCAVASRSFMMLFFFSFSILNPETLRNPKKTKRPSSYFSSRTKSSGFPATTLQALILLSCMTPDLIDGPELTLSLSLQACSLPAVAPRQALPTTLLSF